MDADKGDLDELAGSILDGTSVDWRTVQSNANEAERPLVEVLHVLSTFVDFHRQQRTEEMRVPQTWGHIRVIELLGTGAFGHVYRAWDTRLDREVALKLLPARSNVDAARTPSIIEEGRLLARVRHRNVVTIYGAERIADTVGLWMELVDGETVEQRLTKRRPFQPSEVIEIGTQICHAVSAVHAAGLLHRDIKAQNVMLATDGRAVLMDFGTGWDMSEASASTGALAGTPLYLAPELLRGGEATIQSDIYSIGVLFYRMLTGTYPVRAHDFADLRVAHERRKRGDVVALLRDVGRRLADIVERAIDPDAERRYASVDAVATALAELQPRRAVVPPKSAIVVAVALVLGGLLLWAGALGLHREAAATQAGLPQTTAVQRLSDGPAIAVLPLKNLSTEAGGEEFADGFTEEIINGLAANEHLQVRSRTSTFAFKKNEQDLRDVARQLDVSLVLDGSVRRLGNRFQVEARLVQAATGVTLWNETFDTDIGNVFGIRNRIIQSVVGRLGVKAAPNRRAYDLNPEAYGRYLTARALVSRRGFFDAQKAIEYFKQVIAVAPDFAPAYAGMADAYAYMSLPTYLGVPVARAQELMRTAAVKALELDPDLAEAHAAMGLVYARDMAWASSEQHFEQAIALNPSLSQVYTSYSFFTLRPLRKFGKAERLLKIAMQRDPLSLDVWRQMAEVDFTVGRFDEAIDLLQRVRAVDPQLPAAAVILARALACRGRLDEALALYDAIKSENAGAPVGSRLPEGVPQYQAYALVKAGRRSDAERLARENEQYPYRATIIYAALGERDRALEALNQTASREPQRIPLLLTWPEMAPLRSDPRFVAVQKHFGLP
ncbi:MAG TPA: protein kinase [Vicinamibacterales bacterium]|nr:protein kinase [Vicinamibacterales bacterium]